MTTHTLKSLADELIALRIQNFDYDFAWALGSKLRRRAQQSAAPVAIEVRHGADVVFATLLPGATIDNFAWTRRKSAVAHRFHRSSLAIRLESEAKGYDLNTAFRLPPDEYVASGGGFPLILTSGVLIGSVGVSGLPDVEDHEFITTTLATM